MNYSYFHMGPCKQRRHTGGVEVQLQSFLTSKLDGVKKNIFKVLTLWVKRRLASAGTVKCLVSGILEERRHNRFRATSADVKDVKTTNSYGSAEQEDESSVLPPYSPDLVPSDCHLYGPLKDALRRRRFPDGDDMKRSFREELRRFSKEF
jgi:hypothetical protein